MTSKSRRIYCSVYGCMNKSTANPELSFFSIPSNPERRTQWLRLIGREDLKDKGPHNSVCQAHFDPQDVQINPKRKLLKKNSVPIYHLPVTAPIERAEKETQCEVPTTWSVSTQTDEADLVNLQVKEEIKMEEEIQVKEEIIEPDDFSETATSFSADNTRKRKFVEIPICEDSNINVSIYRDSTR